MDNLRVADHIPAHPEREEWDVLVVGTGMGGSTIGHELARLGRRVLFLEKGKMLHGNPLLEEPGADGYSVAEIRLRTGRWPVRLEGRTNFGRTRFFAPMGCGSGGSTALFGAQLERFSPADFRPRANHPGVAAANLPEQWPISYDQLVPYYRRAEALHRVCGTPDPLNPDPDAPLRAPPPLSDRDRVLHDSLVDLGLHPYRSHVGFHHIPECHECFDICGKDCKGDAGGRSLVPALTRHGAGILPRCEVLELVASGSRVDAVRAKWNGAEIRLSARIVVLGAGAFMTPVLLLNSRSAAWPGGLANRSGLVGRNLMLHTSDFVTIDHRDLHSTAGPRKSLALNDFYFDQGRKLGTLQEVGLPMLPAIILDYLRFVEEKDPRWWRRPIRRLLPGVAEFASRHFRRAALFATVVEDLPYRENRVIPDPSASNGMRFEYAYPRELLERNRHFRRRLAQRLAPRHRVSVVTGGTNNINYGHVCGTCRFGEDPDTSVLDSTNRAHDLDNLYVVDASFFPSSGGINPSLTIAANALRVAEVIHGALP
jgi:choline dehydrogenase-like flavoprotein